MPDTASAKLRPAWLKPFARLGYGSRGLVYLVIAFFAILAAMRGGENKDAREAIDFLSGNPFGEILTLVLIVGLVSYSLWRLTQSAFDTDDHGRDLTGIGIRLGLLASCITYAALALYASSLWWGRGAFAQGGGDDGGDVASTLAGLVGARYAALTLATVFLVVGGAHIWKAVRRKYRDHIAAPGKVDRFVDPVAITGLIARGLIFLLLALLFYRRGLTAGEDGNEPGLEAALDYILSLPAGNWLLAATGLGLLAFSIYSFAEALWRRINVEEG